MWKSSLRVVEFCAINNFSVSVHNLISLPNGTYFLDVPRIFNCEPLFWIQKYMDNQVIQ